MAYLGYDTRVRVKTSRPETRPARFAWSRLAWARLAVVAASLLAWTGVIAGARALF